MSIPCAASSLRPIRDTSRPPSQCRDPHAPAANLLNLPPVGRFRLSPSSAIVTCSLIRTVQGFNARRPSRPAALVRLLLRAERLLYRLSLPVCPSCRLHPPHRHNCRIDAMLAAIIRALPVEEE